MGINKNKKLKCLSSQFTKVSPLLSLSPPSHLGLSLSRDSLRVSLMLKVSLISRHASRMERSLSKIPRVPTTTSRRTASQDPLRETGPRFSRLLRTSPAQPLSPSTLASTSSTTESKSVPRSRTPSKIGRANPGRTSESNWVRLPPRSSLEVRSFHSRRSKTSSSTEIPTKLNFCLKIHIKYLNEEVSN